MVNPGSAGLARDYPGEACCAGMPTGTWNSSESATKWIVRSRCSWSGRHADARGMKQCYLAAGAQFFYTLGMHEPLGYSHLHIVQLLAKGGKLRRLSPLGGSDRRLAFQLQILVNG